MLYCSVTLLSTCDQCSSPGFKCNSVLDFSVVPSPYGILVNIQYCAYFWYTCTPQLSPTVMMECFFCTIIRRISIFLKSDLAVTTPKGAHWTFHCAAIVYLIILLIICNNRQISTFSILHIYITEVCVCLCANSKFLLFQVIDNWIESRPNMQALNFRFQNTRPSQI